MTRQIITVCVVLSIVLTGCSRQAEPEQTVPPLTMLFEEVRSAMDAGNTTVAVSLLDEAYTDEKFTEDRGQILNAALSIQLGNGMTEAAIARFYAVAQQEPGLVEYSFGMLANALRDTEDHSLLLNWTTSLLPMQFSDHTMAALYITHAQALMANEQSEAVLQLVPDCKEKFNTPTCVKIYRGIISFCLSTGNTDAAKGIIDAVEKVSGDMPELTELVAVSRLDLLAGAKRWDDYFALLTKKISALSSHGVSTALSKAMAATEIKRDSALRERICLLIIDSRAADEQCVVSAARHWLGAASDLSPAHVPSRTRKLIEKGIAADSLLRFLPKAFYAVLNMEDPAKLKEMVTIAKSMSPNVTEERNKTTLNSMILDGSFILNDYDTAIMMVEQGVPGRDDNWHASALVKLKAHRALDAGDIEEAVKHFRQFMKIIADTMDREVDPSTGMTYTANWCLGRNAKRIGDLLKKAGKTERSAKAYLEARAHFEKALVEFEENSREAEAIKKEMVDIPGA